MGDLPTTAEVVWSSFDVQYVPDIPTDEHILSHNQAEVKIKIPHGHAVISTQGPFITVEEVETVYIVHTKTSEAVYDGLSTLGGVTHVTFVAVLDSGQINHDTFVIHVDPTQTQGYLDIPSVRLSSTGSHFLLVNVTALSHDVFDTKVGERGRICNVRCSWFTMTQMRYMDLGDAPSVVISSNGTAMLTSITLPS